MSDYIAIPYPKRYGYESVRLIKLVRTASDRPLSGDEEIMIAQHNEIATLKEQNALLTVQVQRSVTKLQIIADDMYPAPVTDFAKSAIAEVLSDLPQQVKSDARDAERYRYLRSHNAEQFDRLVEESLDEAIDEAISAQEEKGRGL